MCSFTSLLLFSLFLLLFCFPPYLCLTPYCLHLNTIFLCFFPLTFLPSLHLSFQSPSLHISPSTPSCLSPFCILTVFLCPLSPFPTSHFLLSSLLSLLHFRSFSPLLFWACIYFNPAFLYLCNWRGFWCVIHLIVASVLTIIGYFKEIICIVCYFIIRTRFLMVHFIV